ncbi:MAG: phosphodiester glycosidase family protein [Eubacteriales bacterium]
MNLTAIIPSLNPDEKLLQVVSSLIDNNFKHIIVIDDGSEEKHKCFFDKIEKLSPCVVLRHEKNCGKGVALKTAFQYYLEKNTTDIGVVTVDGDNQHRAEDVFQCAQVLNENPNALVLGVRSFKNTDVPLRSRLGNKLTSLIFKFVCGLKISDTQTGLRAISNENILKFLDVIGDRYEYETNMLLETQNSNISIIEVKIASIYIENNKNSHFRPIIDSWRIYKTLIKFIFSSMASFIVDILMFWLLHMLLPISSSVYLILVASLGARSVSSILNYSINHKIVFAGSSNSRLAVIIRYYLLCVLQAGASFYGVYLLSLRIQGNIVLLKIVVDTVLFFISFYIQREWVFQKKTSKKNDSLAKKVGEKSNFWNMFEKVKSVCPKVLIILLVLLVSAIVLLFGATAIISYGPSQSMRNIYVSSTMESSAGKILAKIYFSNIQIKQIMDSNRAQPVNTVTDSTMVNVTQTLGAEKNEIEVEDVKGSSFIGKMMIIHDPSRVYVATPPVFGNDESGMKLEDMVRRDNAVAGINAGGFYDPNGLGKGGVPLGIVIHNGNLMAGSLDTKSIVIGFDQSNNLIVGNMTAQEALDKSIKEAVSFGPVLIVNGEPVPILGTGGGLNPRTAIGQRKDGAVLLLVVDGRHANSIGASMKDLVEVMCSYGAVNAANLDGGSSALMIYKGRVLNSSASLEGPRKLPTAFLVK